MKKTALFPGTFDPVTLGHIDLIRRAIPLFDKLIIGIGENTGKEPMFSLEKRKQWLSKIFIHDPQIKVDSYSGLTVDYCRQQGVDYILRGIRSYADFEYEKAIADLNRAMAPEVETLFLPSQSQWASLSSTLVRDIIKHRGNLSLFLPAELLAEMEAFGLKP